MNKKTFIIATFILIILTLMNTSTTKAWGPITHVYYTERALKQSSTSTITEIIEKHKDYFYTGVMYPDVTVLYYYTEWTSYSATHAWEFQRRLWQDAKDRGSEEAMAFALGVGVHLLQDSITHNYWIPYKIRTTFVQNNIIHPLSEGLLEAKLASEDPQAEFIASKAFIMWNVPFSDGDWSDWGYNPTPAEWCDRILGNPGFLDECATFSDILGSGSFYTKGYVIPESGGIWGIYKAISDAIAPFVSTDDANQYINQSIEVTVKWFSEGQGDNPIVYVGEVDPTGYDALKSADNFVVNWTITVTIIFILLAVVYYFKKR